MKCELTRSYGISNKCMVLVPYKHGKGKSVRGMWSGRMCTRIQPLCRRGVTLKALLFSKRCRAREGWGKERWQYNTSCDYRDLFSSAAASAARRRPSTVLLSTVHHGAGRERTLVAHLRPRNLRSKQSAK